MSIKQIVKDVLIGVGIPATKNLKYDILTFKILKKELKSNSNCIDVGGLKGEIMEYILKKAPGGIHSIFEPIPEYAGMIKKKFANTSVTLYQMALCDQAGELEFNYVVNYPSYSGLKKRDYPDEKAEVKKIKVRTDQLDHVIPPGLKIELIKIDVEGAEFNVLKGAVNTIRKSKPIIIFEFGLGASEYYGSTPEDLFDFMDKELNYSINLLDRYLKNKPSLSRDELSRQYNQRINYYFVAYPGE
nr:FkbM family methyltransferase [Bacteroidota bacterium]